MFGLHQSFSLLRCPKSIDSAVTEPTGKEGVIFAPTFKRSFILALPIGLLALARLYVLSWMIPGYGEAGEQTAQGWAQVSKHRASGCREERSGA
jgi:hypothetical protein